MRFSQIAKGTRAERPVEIELGGETLKFAVRPLIASEEGDVAAGARTYAESKGVKNPTPGDALYDLGLAMHTIALGCVDLESPADKRAPYFDGGVAQILDSDVLGRDAIAYVYEIQQRWQDECAPRKLAMAPDEFAAAVVVIGGEDKARSQLFFGQLRPGMQWHFTHFLASLWLNSPTPRSGSGSDTGPTAESSSKKPETLESSSKAPTH